MPAPRNIRNRSALAGTLLIALAAGLPAAMTTQASAQVEAASTYEGRPIREVLFRTPSGAPLDGLDLQRALNNSRTAPGQPFDPEAAQEDLARLNRLNVFRRARLEVRPLADRSLSIIFTLEPRPVIEAIEVAGNNKFTDNRLLDAAGLIEGIPVDRFAIDRAARRIEELYREDGYYLAEVTVDDQALEDSGVVVFQVREGNRVKIEGIRFEGFDGKLPYGRNVLIREIETRPARLLNRGAIDTAVLESDTSSLIAYFRDRGYLDARADYEIEPAPNGKEAIITFIIEQGRRYTLRDVRVEYAPGAEVVFDQAQALGLMTLKPGDVFGVTRLRESVEAVRDALGTLGYTDAGERGSSAVTAVEYRDPTEPLVDLVLRINPGTRYRVGEIIVQGNTLSKQKLVLRQTDLRPGRPLDTTAVRDTESALRRVGLFDPSSIRVTLQQPDRVDPRYRDVLIQVEETNTGSFDLGGAVSTDAGIIGRIALTQNNFDVADLPDSGGEFFLGRAFRGAGQRFVIEALPGNLIQRYSLGLSEPYLFETNFSGSAQAFYRFRDFDEFDEERFGGRYSIARRFGTRWSGALNFRTEIVTTSDILPTNPTDFFLFEGNNLVLGVGPRLIRSTLDNNFLPTRGTRTELGFEQTFGDVTFTRFDAEHTVFYPLREDFLGRATVISLNARVGYIPQPLEDVPVFERFYLGGSTFRGFEFRTVSPRGVSALDGSPSDLPIGGDFLFFLGSEIRHPLLEDVLYLAGFIDTGTVSDGFSFDEYRVSVGVGLRLSIPQLSPAPLAFDFGFPLVKEDTDEDQLFNFTIDVPF